MSRESGLFKLFFLVTVVLLANLEQSFAQSTQFYGSRKIDAEGHTGALYDVHINRQTDYTFVRIELVPTRNLNRLNYWSSYKTKIKSGDFEASLVGALSADGTSHHSCECEDKWGWKDAKAGKSYYYTLIFKGAIPPGLTDFSLIDEGSQSGCRGFGFKNYTLNNPDTHPKTYLTQQSLLTKIDAQNDGIVGIYEPFDKFDYKLACIQEGGSYKLVYLSGNPAASWWKFGDVKAVLRPSATAGLFKADWYMSDKSLNTDIYVTFDGLGMQVSYDKETSTYLKMYPTNSTFNASKSQKAFGTGFAISSNGYIVTNYHVIENATTVEVKGIRGDFSKKYSAKVVVSDEKNDLAILKINDPYFNSLGTIPYTFKQSMAEVGENVFVLGYPMIRSMGEEIKLTNGIISSKTGYKGDIALYQISAPIQPGNSGGPLFDANGNLIGIINAKHSNAENASYAIKLNYLTNLIDLLPQQLNMPKANALNGKGLTEQVKLAANYVYLIVVNDN